MNQSIEKKHILLVNPSDHARALLRDQLTQDGFVRISEAVDGLEAIQHLRVELIDLLITDIPLQRVDGWRLVRLLRSGVFHSKHNIPILVVSQSYCKHIAKVTAKEFEVNAFISLQEIAKSNLFTTEVRNCLTHPDATPWKSQLLVIEDYPDTARLVERVLGKQFEIEMTKDGEEGLQAWLARRHSLVLLDVMLPKCKGEDVLQKILEIAPQQPIVIMTAFGSVENSCKLLLGGAVDFVTKPFRGEQLRRVCSIAARRVDYLKANQQVIQFQTSHHYLRQQLEVTLGAIQDAVIASDLEANIEFMNPAAEQLTGWCFAENQKAKISERITILDPVSRSPAECLVQQCITRQEKVQPAQPRLLIPRNHNECLITETATPLFAPEGPMMGVIYVLRPA